MAATITKLCLIAVVVSQALCWVPRFINGRSRGGMLGAPRVAKDTPTPPALWFKQQRLDHFDGSNNRHWSQRYFVNDTFYQPGGPIFLMIGGEGPANPIWMVEGAWQVYAQKYGAITVMLEHRYYGDSHPVPDLSLENLRYLSSRQALADLAEFIDYFRSTRNLTANKLITFGGSYPGSLSAWFRSKYPQYVDGAVATSAPIHAQVNFPEYLEVATDALQMTGSQCVEEIRNATTTMAAMLSDAASLDKLQTMFRLCDKIDPGNHLDIAGLFSNTAGNFENVIQYNRDNRAFEGAVGTDITLDTLCSMMTDFTHGDPLQRYANVNSLILDTYQQKCLDFTYDKMVADMRKTDWASGAAEGGRQWTYQTCAEFGWYQSSDFTKQPFSFRFPLKYSLLQCQDIYNDSFTEDMINENVRDTNRFYGDRNIAITKVVFPNGSIDPWHAMGVTKDISPEATAIYIEGTAHCANMYPARDDDLKQLTDARATIDKLIGMWLQDKRHA